MGLQALGGVHWGRRRQEGGPMSVLSGQGQARAEKSPHQGMLGAGSWGMEHRQKGCGTQRSPTRLRSKQAQKAGLCRGCYGAEPEGRA